ncbi:hypothetical protein ACIGXM_18640 [Kitasatospora sp. NPDC052896]|uniref:hypothetical protein n=1 Tax=Kitasatospora sp. NPDC052896 TaxID=3364061 RepID=UPI0037C9B470
MPKHLLDHPGQAPAGEQHVQAAYDPTGRAERLSTERVPDHPTPRPRAAADSRTSRHTL